MSQAISMLLYEFAKLIALCAASYFAASFVLGISTTFIAYVVAYCAAFGACTATAVLIDNGERGVRFIAREIRAHRLTRASVRFYTLNA